MTSISVATVSSDAELMRRVQSDDADAFEELYDRHAARALRIASSVCRNPKRAEDAVQEGFLSAWRSRANYRPEAGEVCAWVMVVVRNRAIDIARRNVNHDTNVVSDHTLDALAASDDVPAQVIANERAAAIRQLLDELPETQREVIQLAFYGGLTHSEIAQQLNLPAGTVKGRMRLGLNKLRPIVR